MNDSSSFTDSSTEWSYYFDTERNLCYYYNHQNKMSQWNQPDNCTRNNDSDIIDRSNSGSSSTSSIINIRGLLDQLQI